MHDQDPAVSIYFTNKEGAVIIVSCSLDAGQMPTLVLCFLYIDTRLSYNHVLLDTLLS
jgi:hypothetical protein